MVDMFIWGRLLGTIFVFLAFQHPIAGAIGFIIGHFFDKGMKNVFDDNKAVRDEVDVGRLKTLFMQLLFTSVGHLAKADGRVCEREIEHAEQMMLNLGFDEQARDQAIVWFQQGIKQDNDLQQLLGQFVASANARADLKQVLLESLISLALVDGELHHQEEHVLRNIAMALGINAEAFMQLLQQIKAQMHFSKESGGTADGLDRAYQALGVDEGVDDKDLKQAYRRLMSRHHPDKLMAQGVPEDAIKLATAKSQAIQAAYELIKKHRSTSGKPKC